MPTPTVTSCSSRGGWGWRRGRRVWAGSPRHGPARRVDLFVGFRSEDQIYDGVGLRQLQQENPWLTVTVAVSHDTVSSLEHGDIGDVVLRHGPWTSREVCIAGPGPMVEDTVARLLQPGVPPQRMS